MLLSLRPVISVAEALRKLKGASTARVHDAFPGTGGFSWQDRYGAFSVAQFEIRGL